MQPRSARLNQNNREKFIRMVMEDKLPDSKMPTVDDFKEEWKGKIFDVCFGDYKELLNQMPKWMKIKSDVIRVSLIISGKRTDKVAMPMDQEYWIPYGFATKDYYYGGIEVQIPDTHPIHKAYSRIIQSQEDFSTKRRELRTQVSQLVYSCNTSGQLYKAWPEAIKYSDCFPYVAPNRSTAPAVTATELEIGLLMSEADVDSVTDDE